MPTGDGLTTRGAIAIYATGFFSLAFLVIMGLAVPLWTVVLHASPAIAGLVLGAPALLPLIFSIHVGTLMDQTDTRIVMLVLAIFGTILPLLYPILPWIPALLALQCLAGFIYQLSWVGAQTLMGRAFPGDHRHYGRFSSAASVGMFLGPLLDGFAWSAFGPWGAFGLASLWGLGFTIAVFALPGLEKSSTTKVPWRASLVPDFQRYVAALRLLKLPAIVLVVLATSLRISASAIRGSFYSVYLSHDAHMPGSQIGILLAFGALVGSVAALLVEFAIRLCGSRRRALIIAVALAILGITITPLMPNFALLAVAMAVFGVGMGVNQPILLAILSSAVSYENQGLSTGLRSTANLIASLGIPVVMGLVIEAAGMRHGFYIMGAALLFACIIVFSATHDVESPHEISERAAGR